MNLKQRTNKLKLDSKGEWVGKLNLILDDILQIYHNKHDVELLDWITAFQLQKQDELLHIVLLTDFAESVYHVAKYLPFLIALEKFEECAKINKCIEHFAVEKIKQAQFVGVSQEMEIDEFIDLIILQKDTIINELLEADDRK